MEFVAAAIVNEELDVEWSPPSAEIQRLFKFDRQTNEEVISKKTNNFTDEEFAKIPSTLMKAIRRTDALLEQTETARKQAIDTNNELKGIQTLLLRYAKRVVSETNKTESKPSKINSCKGFRRPCYISDALCNFLNVPSGTLQSRVEVNHFINEYVKTNNLIKRQYIVPDDKLWTILSDNAKDNKITYFSIQKYIKHHFVSAETPANKVPRS